MKIFVKEHTESLVKQLMDGDLSQTRENRRALRTVRRRLKDSETV